MEAIRIMPVVINGTNILILNLIFLTLTGCSIHYTDSKGHDHFIGLASIKIEKNKCVVTNTVKSLGINLDFTSDTGGANLGFRTTSKSYINQNQFVQLDSSEQTITQIIKLDSQQDCSN